MNGAITAHFRWTPEEFIAVQRIAMRHSALTRRWKQGTLGWGVVMLALGTTLLVLRNFDPMGFVFLVLGSILLLAPLFSKRLLLKHYFQRHDRDASVRYELRPDIVVYETQHSRAELAWSVFRRAVKTSKGVLLFVNDRDFHWLPEHAFEDGAELDGFWRLVVDRVAQHKTARL